MDNRDELEDRGSGPAATSAEGSEAQNPKPEAAPIKATWTRASSFWIGLIGGIIALVIILVFILQNLHDAHATFFGVHWDIPLGIDLLLAAVLGGLIVFIAGTTRILQLRLVARRQHRALEKQR
jgi:uncharacterized integral membrane protein